MKGQKVIFYFLSICLILLLGAPTGFAAKKFPAAVIYRDSYGVPHVYANTVYGLFYGYGYAIATDRLFQMEMAKRAVEGTVAEVLGSDYAVFDKGVLSNYRPDSIMAQYHALKRQHKAIFDGYAAGMNKRIDEILQNTAPLPKQFSDYGLMPEKWTAFDVIMIFVGTMCNRYSDFNAELPNLGFLEYLMSQYDEDTAWDIFDQVKWVNDPGAPTTVPPAMSLAASKTKHHPSRRLSVKGKGVIKIVRAERERILREKRALARFGLPGLVEVPLASNVWIVGKGKTFGKKAIIMNGPQFSHFNPGYVYEIGLHGAGFNLVGCSPFGYPALLFAHNAHIAWGSTAGVGDLVDIYEERLNPADPYQYWYNGEWRDMEKRTETIQVKGEAPQTVDIYRTVHGFVIQFDIDNNIAYSKKRTWEGFELESLIGWIESTKARNHWQWRKAAAKMAISINWYFADKRGNIGYIHTGKYPIRREGYDHRMPAPGTGEFEWLGVLPFSGNPQVYNPKQSYITNWNNKPAVFWNDADFYSWGSVDRVNAIIDELEARGEFTKEEIWEMNQRLSHVDLSIDYLLPFMEEAVAGSPGSREAEAVEMLKNWDRYRWDLDEDGYYDSPAQTIFEKWLEVMLEKTFEDDLRDQFGRVSGTGYPPGNSPSTGTKVLYHSLLGPDSTIPNNYDFFNGADPGVIIFNALTETLSALTASFGTSDMNEWLTPVVPLKFSYKNFLGIPQAGPDEDLYLPISMNRGTQNHMVELKPWKADGCNVCPPGASGFVAQDGTKDPHYSDQMELYRAFESKPMLFYFRDVLDDATDWMVLNLN